jgi:hypothetical protein
MPTTPERASSDIFLTRDEIATHTGRKLKSKQIEALRTMGSPFFVNATGHPVVARAAIDGNPKRTEKPKELWVPKVLRHKH